MLGGLGQLKVPGLVSLSRSGFRSAVYTSTLSSGLLVRLLTGASALLDEPLAVACQVVPILAATLRPTGFFGC